MPVCSKLTTFRKLPPARARPGTEIDTKTKTMKTKNNRANDNGL
jgi:hypothetical protein